MPPQDDVTQSEGYKKMHDFADSIRKETQEQEITKKEEMKSALVTLESLKSLSNIGMKGIDAEDIRPPMMFLVQGIKDKSELVDKDGHQCPDGKFFLKGVNEIVDTVQGNFVWVKKDHYKKEGNVWDGTRMYRVIFVRTSDMMPFAMNFNKSSLSALSDLFTAKTSQGYPLFVFKTEIKAVLTTNKQGIQYWKTVVNVRGLEDDSEKLAKLQELAQQFDMRSDIPVADEEITSSPGTVSATEDVSEIKDVSNDFEADMNDLHQSLDNPLI
jgi:hypothetical protein